MSRRLIVDELEVEVPYGKLAAKTWHEETEDCKRILILHGWMDNCGSFDNLVPLIKSKDDLYIVGLDFPGHGRSSQLPPGAPYSDFHLITEIRRFLTELGWVQKSARYKKKSNASKEAADTAGSSDTNGELRKKFTILGHSLGACLGIVYANLFPDDVEDIISLDFIKSMTWNDQELLDISAATIDTFIETVPSVFETQGIANNKSSENLTNQSRKFVDKGQVIVSRETAIVATIEAHKNLGSLTRDQAICLLKRSTIDLSAPSGSVVFFRDLRLKCMLHTREHWFLNATFIGSVKCGLLCIMSKQGLYSKNDAFSNQFADMVALFKSNCERFFLQWMDNGDHYIHLSEPQRIADVINKYLESPRDFKVT